MLITNSLLQQDEAHFPHSNKFIPERWLKNDDSEAETGCPSARTAHPFVFIPFGFGPRSCIGRRFAEMEVEIILARFVRQYHIEWNYPPIEYVNSIILSPVSELRFKLTELND